MGRERIHILGICGTFMGGIALLAKEVGFEVTGSDENIYPPMSEHLSSQNIDVIDGYEINNIPKADIYLIGNVLSRGNIAVEHILKSGLPFSSGSAWLAQNILKGKRVLAVSGTHGKTTTTSMISWILESNGLDIGYIIAGKPENFKRSARLGSNDIFVIEADEYDSAFFDKRAKFIHYLPEVLVINNLEFDHADIYSDISQIQKEFHNLLRTMSKKSSIIIPDNDLRVREVIKMGLWSNLITFGQAPSLSNFFEPVVSDYSKIRFSIEGKEKEMSWKMFGKHNAFNALASILAVKELNISLSNSIAALENFLGVSRRQEVLIEKDNFVLIDDFAHHPTAIKETLEGIRNRYKERRVIAFIELRSNTMKSGLHDQNLIKSVENADVVYWGGNDKKQINSLIEHSPVKSNHIYSIEKAVKDTVKDLNKGDVVILMSNGNFGDLGKKLKVALEHS